MTKSGFTRIGVLAVVSLFGGASTTLAAQGLPGLSPARPPLQSSKLLEAGSQAPSPGAVQVQPSTSIVGTIRDAHGAAIPEVRVTLVRPDGEAIRVTTADDKGHFTFPDLAPGPYRVTIDAAGLEPFASAALVLEAGQRHELPVVALRLPTTITTVDVSATLDEVAQEQVKEQEKQRILGFLPNYYTSYIWNAAPMTPQLKYHMALKTSLDPMTFIVVGSIAGVEQAHKTFPGYGQGFEGYAKRFGSSYADTVSGRMFGSAIFPALLHQDPRYYYRGSGSVRSRVLHALLSTIICRGDNGTLEPNYSHVFGSFAAAGLSNLYRSPEDRRAGLTLRNGLIITGSGAVVNLMREFISRQLTPSVPKFAKGKP